MFKNAEADNARFKFMFEPWIKKALIPSVSAHVYINGKTYVGKRENSR